MKARSLFAYIAPSLRPKQRCEGCGQKFHCGASLWGFWCAQIKLSDATRADLRAKYPDCFCRAYLEAVASCPR